MNLHRDLIYKDRRKVLFGESVSDNIKKMVQTVASDVVARFTTEKYVEDWDFEGLRARVEYIYNIPDLTVEKEEMNGLTQQDLIEKLTDRVMKIYEDKEAEFGTETFNNIERDVLLSVVDEHWMDHIDAM